MTKSIFEKTSEEIEQILNSAENYKQERNKKWKPSEESLWKDEVRIIIESFEINLIKMTKVDKAILTGKFDILKERLKL